MSDDELELRAENEAIRLAMCFLPYANGSSAKELENNGIKIAILHQQKQVELLGEIFNYHQSNFTTEKLERAKLLLTALKKM